MTEVFLENKSLDLSEGLSNLLTYQLDDIKDIGSRNTAFSKTIIFPGTSNNNIQFGHIFDVRVSNQYDSTQRNVGYNFNPSQQAGCVIFQDHLQVFKGILRLNKMIILDGVCEYECTVLGEFGGLVNSIGAAKIEDLDFSLYDHSFGTTNIIDSWDNESGVGYYYPLIDYGTVSTNKVDYDIQAFRPAFFVREYIDKIFTAAGYDYSCALFDTDRFKRLVVPNNSKDFKRPATYILEVGATSEHYLNTDGPIWPIEFPTHTTVSDFTIDAFSEVFTYVGSSAFSGTIRLMLGGTFTKNSLYPFPVTLSINGVVVGNTSIGNGQTSGGYSISIPYNTVLNSGDFIQAFVSAPSLSTVWDLTMFAGLTAQSITASLVDITNGAQVTVNDHIPKNVLQIDFLSSVIKLFNLYVYEDSLKTKFLNIAPQVDFYDLNVSDITDWTYKLDRSRVIELTPMSELNSRYYDFKFKKDNDYYNDFYQTKYGVGYGDYLFDSDYTFSRDKTSVELIFAASPLVGYAGVDKIVPAIYKKSAGVEERISSVIRILQTKKITGVTSWAIKNGASTLVSGLNNYGYGGHYDDPDAPANDIQFGVPYELFFVLSSGAINVTQFNVYWSSYMAEITDKDSKLLSAFFKLLSKDIFGLNFSKLVYVDGSYWRLNKVIDWNASDPDVCKVELLKAIILIY